MWQFFCKQLQTFQRISQLITFLMMFLENSILGGGKPITPTQRSKPRACTESRNAVGEKWICAGSFAPPAFFLSIESVYVEEFL